MKKVCKNLVYEKALLDTLKIAKTYPSSPYWGSFEKIFIEFINTMFVEIVNEHYSEKTLIMELQKIYKQINVVSELWER